ncbi:hypothetical protein SUDANB174_06252 [Streptomyces sp. enrichment culture]
MLPYFAKQAHASTDGGQVAVGRSHPGPGGDLQSYEEALNASASTTRYCAPSTCSSTPS